AYETHARGESSLPHSSFLLFPGQPRDRIIALPAYLGGSEPSAGIKWVSSFPGNLELGLDRASAVLILNSTRTGRPESFIEGSVISAKRTAASAALAAQHLQGGRRSESASLIGCGLINFEIARFLLAACPEIRRLTLFDLSAARARHFAERCRELDREVEVELAPEVKAALGASPLVALATTAATPHIHDLSPCADGATLLHISLRDLAPEVILASDNVVDDVDHVSRAQTSIHLAEQQVGNRDFVRCTLADVTSGAAPARREEGGITVFSPFGLGVLDLAVGKLVQGLAREQGRALVVDSFLPEPWEAKH
ncbi:MAG: 2,3-diaminopropionate biosynthesis protein SbnB, partial [Acidobacteriota bacterium]|nr:2,3-diaminopropionate biosynthesis protein SbnB [Acidobacteriota bacterium]